MRDSAGEATHCFCVLVQRLSGDLLLRYLYAGRGITSSTSLSKWQGRPDSPVCPHRLLRHGRECGGLHMPYMPRGEGQVPSWNAKKNHVRQDSRCRLHGLEQRHPPPAQGGERVSRTTENLVKIQCDGVAVGDTATWHRLIEKFVPVETTWLSRPLLLQKGEAGERTTRFLTSAWVATTPAQRGTRWLESCAKPETWTASGPKALLELYRR